MAQEIARGNMNYLISDSLEMASARIKTTEKENVKEREKTEVLRRKWERQNAATIDRE